MSERNSSQIPAPSNSNGGDGLRYTFKVTGGNLTAAGSVSARIKSILQQIGVKPETVRRASVAMYEAETNIVIYASGGEISLCASPTRIRILVQDEGPGIPDMDLAMKPGHSTASGAVREMGFGAGMGLPNIRKCADVLNIRTQVGTGTTLDMVFRNE